MVDVDTFLTTLCVMIDDFCQSHWPTEQRPGPDASLSHSEVLTLPLTLFLLFHHKLTIMFYFFTIIAL